MSGVRWEEISEAAKDLVVLGGLQVKDEYRGCIARGSAMKRPL